MKLQAINNTSFKATICNDYRSKVTNNIGKVIHTSKRNYWNSLIRESEIDRNKVQLDEAFASLFNDDNSDVILTLEKLREEEVYTLAAYKNNDDILKDRFFRHPFADGPSCGTGIVFVRESGVVLARILGGQGLGLYSTLSGAVISMLKKFADKDPIVRDLLLSKKIPCLR